MTTRRTPRDPGRRAFLGAAAVGTGAVLASVAAPGVARAAEGAAPQVDFPNTPGSFAVASVLTLLALVTLVLKVVLERKTRHETATAKAEAKPV